METKANYLLIGAFTILGFLGLLGFLAWFSKVELDRQFAYYDVYFENVSGLNNSSTVKFAGLGVGQVVDLTLSEARDGTVRVRLEVAADTPVRTDSIATIESQGVTGVSFVGISAGEPQSPLLPTRPTDPAVIEAGRSTLSSLAQDAPALLEEALTAMERINHILSPENQNKVDTILSNVQSSSAKVNETLDDFSRVSSNVGSSIEEISDFTTQLGDISSSVTHTLEVAERALISIDDFAAKAKDTLDAGTVMVNAATDTVTIAGSFVDTELTALVQDVTVTSASLRDWADVLSTDASEVLNTWSQTGRVTTDRLSEIETLFTSANLAISDLRGSLASVDGSAIAITDFVQGAGSTMANDAAEALRTATRAFTPIAEVAEQDIPELIARLNAAGVSVEQAAQQIEQEVDVASNNFSGLTDAGTVTLNEATQAFARSRQTLEEIERTLDAAQSTITAAQSTFEGTNRIVNEDFGPLAENLRGTVARLNAALDQVNEEIPAVAANLRSASENADQGAARFNSLMANVAGPVSSFATEGLTRYTNVARETEQLIKLLESIAAQIERNPSRFILGGDTPTYRRR